VVEDNAACQKQELYSEYKIYCEESGLSAMSSRRFSRELETIPGVSGTLDTVTRRSVWRGIRHA